MKKALCALVLLIAMSALCQPSIIQIPWVVDPLNTTNYSRTNLPAWWDDGTNYTDGVRVWQMTQAIMENFSRLTNNLATNTWPQPSPVWKDQIVSGMALGFGASTPGVVVAGPTHDGLAIRGMGFAWGEDAHAACQLNHDIAPTNSSLPDFYVGPHIHISPTDLSSGTNATFRFVYEWANVNGVYTNIAGAITNSLSFTNRYDHRLLSFGYITNNAAQGSISTVIRFGIERLNGGDGDMGNTRCVVVDSVDIHYPVWRIGSAEPSSD